VTPAHDQLTFALDGLPAPQRGDLDWVRAELVRRQEAVLEAQARERHTAPRCSCARPLLDGRACVKCGREVGR
jgi:hypothetical protein